MKCEIRSLDEALVLLEEWATAYEELRLEHLRLMHRYVCAKQDLAHARYAIECDLWLAEQSMAPDADEEGVPF